ncbi:MAG: hypothetical protein K1X81_13565 [Bacteroidia bacterium]|nr:hypothetical protein [Bacteroidia bacterium]
MKPPLFIGIFVNYYAIIGIGAIYFDTCACTPTVFAEFFDGTFLYKLPSGVPLKMQLTRFDTINSIISGKFDVDLKKENNSEIIHIRNGRFDVKY